MTLDVKRYTFSACLNHVFVTFRAQEVPPDLSDLLEPEVSL